MKAPSVLLSFALLSGCAILNGEPEAPAGTAAFRGTLEPIDVERNLRVPNELRDIEMTQMRGFDRVEFEFARKALPGYTVEYVSDPGRICGTNLPAEVEGERFIKVTFQPTDADVADDWRALNFTNMRGIRQTCARGDSVEYVIGVREREPYRVLELADPSRLVLDVRHDVATPRTAAR